MPIINPIYINTDPQVVKVKIDGAGLGEFTDLAAAVASITDSNPDTKPYVIEIGPGVHVVNNPINIPTGVSIRGAGINATTLKPLNVNQHLLVPQNMCEIAFLNLKGGVGSIGSGKAAIYCEDVGNFAQIHKVSIYDFDIGIENYSLTQESTIYAEYVDINGDYSYAVKNTSDAIHADRVQLENFYTYESGAVGAVHIYSTGAAAEILVNSAGLIGGANNIGILIRDGGSVKVSDVFVQGFSGVGGIGFLNENAGVGSMIDISALTFTGNTSDLQILNPNSTGTIFGALSKDKITIDPLSAFSASFLNLDTQGITLNGKIFYSQNNVADAEDISELIINTPTMGLIGGGELTAGAGLTLNIAAGYGYRMNGTIPNNLLKREEWSNSTLSIPANSNHYVYINTSSLFTSNSTFPDTENNLLLGRVVTDATSILYVETTPLQAHHYNNKIDRVFREAIGPVYAFGSIVTENGARQLNVTAGEYYYSEVEFKPSAGTAISWDAYYRSTTPGVYTKIASQSTVSNSQYDDGSGTLASIPLLQYAKHALYVIGGPSEKYLLVYSQDTFLTSAEAENAPLPLPPGFVTGAFARVASIIVRQGSTNIIEIIDERPRVGFASSSVVGGVTDHGALSGLGDNDHDQYLLRSGANIMAGNLDMGGNSISNVNLVDGIDVTSHASRHLPNGLDPLATGTPSTIGTANSTGVANAFARQDHVHDHGTQTNPNHHAVATTLVNGFMSAADKSKLDGISGTRILKSGAVAAVSFTGAPRTATVTFSTPMPNTNYAISIVGANSRSWSYQTKTVNGFVINTNANTALSGEVLWQAISYGETVE